MAYLEVGYKFGAWLLYEKLPSTRSKSGRSEAQWRVKCLECGHKFKMSGKNMTKRLKKPEHCIACRPYKGNKFKEQAVHMEGIPCGTKIFYCAKTTKDTKEVTCLKCKDLK